MLLLFWNFFGSGLPNDIVWYHEPGTSPRCLCPTTQGLSVINPYMYYEAIECSLALNELNNTSVTLYQNNILLGSESDGVYKIPWDSVKDAECFVDSPADLSDQLVYSYDTSSGILSDSIISLDALATYLAVVTSSGLSWTENGSDFINYTTVSGKKAYITDGPVTYFAEGNLLRRKDGVPSDFVSWDWEYSYPEDINDIWVLTKEGIDTIFVGTTSGAYVTQGTTTYDFGTTISGNKNILSVSAELSTTINDGHFFTLSSGNVNIINMKHKYVENTIDFNNLLLLSVEYPRIYSK